MRIVILEGDVVLLSAIEEYFIAKGHEVTSCISYEYFRKAFKASEYDIVIIDIDLPDGDGIQITKNIRNSNLDIGIIMITSNTSESLYSDGLNSGADYFLNKPIYLMSLEATLKTLTRRQGRGGLYKSAWVLDSKNREISLADNEPITLSHQDTVVLNSIMLGYGKPVSRKEIIEFMGHKFVEYDQRRLDTQIKRLRSKVKKAWELKIPIKTVHAVGYLFSDPVKINH